jgi:hypothetical protein
MDTSHCCRARQRHDAPGLRTYKDFSMVKVIAIWGLVSIACAVLAGILAGMKRRDHSFWAAWSFLFPPMLLLLLVMPANKGPRPRRPSVDELDRQPL